MVKYSLIIPAYNEEKTIEKCILSLKNQSYKDYEIIFVDNNSKDGTLAVAKKLVSKVFSEKKQGYMHAVNKGVAKSNGKFIAICDADSIYPENWLKKVDKHFDNDTVVAVYGTCETYDSNFLLNNLSLFLFSSFLLISKLLGLNNTSGFNFVFSKSSFLKVGGFNPNYKMASPDVILGKQLSNFGKIHLDISIKVFTSSRRFKKNGFLKTVTMFFKLWLDVLFNKTPDISYEEYNKSSR